MAAVIEGTKNVGRNVETPRDGLTAGQVAQVLRRPALI